MSRSTREREKRLAIRRRSGMGLSSRVLEHGADAPYQLVEAFLSLLQLFSSRGGELVILGFAVGVGKRPLGADPLALLHAVKSGVERAFFDLKQVFGGALDVEDDAVSMQFSSLSKRLENQQIETSLKIVPGHLQTPLLLGIVESRPRSGGMSRNVFSGFNLRMYRDPAARISSAEISKFFGRYLDADTRCLTGLCSVLFFAHLLQPVDNFSVELFLDGDVSHGGGWRCPVPVFLAGCEPDDIAGTDLLD